MVSYRILLIDGPEDGDSFIVSNPWHKCWTNNNIYEAARDDTGRVVMEEGDLGDTMVMAMNADGEVYSPLIKTIKMYWTRKRQNDNSNQKTNY